MTADTWETEPFPRSLDEIKESLITDSGIRESVVNRALKRLDNVSSNSQGWTVRGQPSLGDSYPSYDVNLDSNTNCYSCTCHSHNFGETRQRQLCSHVIVVIIAKRLHLVKKAETKELTPASLGLPAKFTEFWETQLQALKCIAAANKRFILLQGPTGAGKTLISAATQRILKTKMLYVCFTKQLQDQFMEDFKLDYYSDFYAADLKGRQNYKTLRYPHVFPHINAAMCTARKETHCRWCCDGDCNDDDDGKHHENSSGKHHEKCNRKSLCPYHVQKVRALASNLACLNFDVFINEANYVGGFSKRQFITIDEADMIESGLKSFVNLTFTKRWIDRLQLEPPKFKTVSDSWIEWAQGIAIPAVNTRLEAFKSQYGVEELRQEEELERVKAKLGFFLKEVNVTKWVFVPEETSWSFKPVFVDRYAAKHLWQHGQRFMLMSATLISADEICHNLGIPRSEAEWIDMPSTFVPQRRPIYYMPAAAINKKNESQTRPLVIKAMDDLLDNHPDLKCLVHTKSYGFAQQVLRLSRHKDRLISYDNAADRIAALKLLKQSDKPLVLVASSMERGIDLPGNNCRVIFVLKLPYADLGDPQVSARLYSDKKGGQMWYAVNAIRALVQSTGRAVRSESDWAICYILDGQFARLYETWKHVFPLWWRDALKFEKGKTIGIDF